MIADLVIVPIHAEFYGLSTAPYTMKRLKEAFLRRGLDRPAPVLLLASLLNRRTASGREVETALLQMGERVAPAFCWRDAFDASVSSHDWVGAFAPGSLKTI
jgi:chromosome partitioning protein